MIIFLGFYMGTKFGLKEYKNHEILSSENVIEEYYENQKYYIIKDDYKGDYDIQYITLSEYFDRKVDIQIMKNIKDIVVNGILIKFIMIILRII